MSLLKHLGEKEGNSKEKVKRLNFFRICQLFENIKKISSTLEKEAILSKFIITCHKNYPIEDLRIFYQLTSKDFSNLELDEETGISTGIFIQSLSELLNKTKDEINFANHGDWGETTQKLWQNSLKSGRASAKEILDSIFLFPKISGKGSQTKKILIIKNILKKSTSIESKYYARLIIGGSLKIGVQEKVIQKSFYSSFPDLQKHQEKIDYSSKVRRLNFGYAVEWYLDNTLKQKLKNLQMEPGHPIKPMLADRGTVELIESEEHFIEEKYDGYRIQAHIKNGKGWLFTRQLTNQTKNLSDILKQIKIACKVKSAIFDGEVISFDLKTGKVLPFQVTIRRKRKYEKEEITSNMHTEYRIFDLIYVDGEDITKKTLEERRTLLESVIDENSVIKLSKGLKTRSPEEALKYAQESKDNGHEGIMIKPISSIYHIGKRDKSWIKIKPETYDLDGVVIGGQYGTGKRQDLISRLFFAFPNEDNDTGSEMFECLGVAIGSGMSEEEMTFFKELFEEKGTEIKPENLLADPSIIPDIWLEPEYNIVIEVEADSFSWKLEDNRSMTIDNIPKINQKIDLTKISLRFPRFKSKREQGKEANTKREIELMITTNLVGSKGK